ncbi:hypothetical protein PISMIDRAFT_341621 [Pisolithus microcarpus 441]|uniref:Uncharacterized protein n=1 Tax=Pisolithus microcarpus 441 TaxID=765257 RepID=A0A0C9Z8G2_9AGAM|nr:hypothetical protein PISMIDRAFT_341621 [Pisolithus microcarpus 441]
MHPSQDRIPVPKSGTLCPMIVPWKTAVCVRVCGREITPHAEWTCAWSESVARPFGLLPCRALRLLQKKNQCRAVDDTTH